LAAFAAMPRVKGVRRLIQGEPDPGFCMEPDFAEATERLEPFGFSFDICVKSFGLAYAWSWRATTPIFLSSSIISASRTSAGV
jgi:predicted TIM-barrel fold metal-dependent hydrolase